MKTAPRYHRISGCNALIILFLIRTADSISHGKNGTWGNRKLVNAHFDKCIGKGAVRRKLAAYACPYSRFVSGIGSHFYHSQHCGVLSVVKAFKSLNALPVHRNGVLGKVICAYGKEAYFLCKLGSYCSPN